MTQNAAFGWRFGWPQNESGACSGLATNRVELPIALKRSDPRRVDLLLCHRLGNFQNAHLLGWHVEDADTNEDLSRRQVKLNIEARWLMHKLPNLIHLDGEIRCPLRAIQKLAIGVECRDDNLDRTFARAQWIVTGKRNFARGQLKGEVIADQGLPLQGGIE
jgi:hypothetical protein